MTFTRGAMNVVSRKRAPVTIEARPVRAPSPTPDADSIYEVLEEMLPTPPAAAATESTKRILLLFGIFPSASMRFASVAIAVTVPTVSKKSDSKRVKTSRTAATTEIPAKWNSPKILK